MGSSRFKFDNLTRLVACFFLLLFWGINAKELHRTALCGEDLLNLECANQSVIAVYEARFDAEAEEENVTCSSVASTEVTESPSENGTCQEDLRVSLNRKCSGQPQCNYSYVEEKNRICNSSRGLIIIRYDCVKETSIHKYCNVRLSGVREGYIAAPGYPRYYPELPSCKWTIEAAEGQTILLHLLHLHMRLPTSHQQVYPEGIVIPPHPEDFHCDDDYLRISEGSLKRLVTCGEDVESLQNLELDAKEGVTIEFFSRRFFPASGFLLHFKIEGCPDLKEPKNGKLVERSNSTAIYVCNEGRVFNDTLLSERTLTCNPNRQRWNDILPPCVVIELQQIYLNKSISSLDNMTFENITNDVETDLIVLKSETFLEDTLIPSILMAVLVVGNAIIVTVILIIRRKMKSKLESEDEMLTAERETPPQATNV